MRVLRGRAETPERDRAVTKELIAHTAETGERCLRAWRPPRQIAFGRRDTNRDGYDRAEQIVANSESTSVDRTVGGHAVAFTGNTLAFASAEPVDDARTGIQRRYDEATTTLEHALADLGADVHEGEPEGSFCPGTHSLSATGKIAGLAQRVQRDAAVVSGIVVVCDHEQIASTLEPLYDALDIEFDPNSVGSVARAGGPSDPHRVARRIEDALIGAASPAIEQVRET
jgi:octanoyl-[GcvH]:protein N-octanoyltransferase